jgi:hypothetical protein
MAHPITEATSRSSSEQPKDGAWSQSTGTNQAACDARIAAVLALAVVTTVLLTRPFAGMPMNDDFSYAHTAKAFAEQGRIVYNGWGSPLILPQTLYGALIIKVFGFSYFALDMAGIVMGGACTVLMYYLARACSLARNVASLVTAVVMLNPISIAIIPSFMTEMPSLAMMLGCLLVLIRSIREDSGGIVHLGRRGLLISLALGIIAGSNRQFLWMAYIAALAVVYVSIPSSRRQVAMAGVATVAMATLLSLWFARQPYTIAPDLVMGAKALIQKPSVAFLFAFSLVNVCCLFCLPLLAVYRMCLSLRNTRLLVCICVFVLCSLFATGFPYTGEWGNYFTVIGVHVGGSPYPYLNADRSIVDAGRLVQTLGAAAVGCTVYAWQFWRGQRSTRQEAGKAEGIAIAVVLAGAITQLVVGLPWYAMGFVYDRYILLVIPGIAIGLAYWIRSHQRGSPRLGWSMMLVLWLIGTGIAWDYMNATRARADLYRSLVAEGISPNRIDAGFELNAETQVNATGYVNNPLLRNPAGAYVPVPVSKYCSFAYLSPVVKPSYLVSPQAIMSFAPFPKIEIMRRSYPNVLPPFTQTIGVYRVSGELDAPKYPRSTVANMSVEFTVGSR